MVVTGAANGRLEAARAARLAAYARFGEVGGDVLSPVMTDGGPAWPVRPAWRMVRGRDRVVLVSDGLSDPWTDRAGAGYGLEVYVEAPDDVLPADAGLAQLALGWVSAAVIEVSNVIANHGGVRALLDELGSVSIEIAGDRFPPALRNDHGRVGVLLGVATDRISYEDGDALLVSATVMTRDELAHVVDHGDDGRRTIAAALGDRDAGHVSRLARASVVEAAQRAPKSPAKPKPKSPTKPKAKAKSPATPKAKAKPKAKLPAKPPKPKPKSKATASGARRKTRAPRRPR